LQHLHDIAAKPLIARRRRSFRLPDSAKRSFELSLARLHASNVSRAWTLPATPFPEEVKHYYSRHRALSAKGPRPRLRIQITPGLAEELALKVDAALSFAELAERADPLVKPILLYYSCAHLCGVYTRAFFEWECDSRKHGITCSHKPSDVPNTVVSIEDSGQFPRIAVTCFLLTGQASLFSPLITYSAKPSAHVAPGELLHKFGQNELGGPLKSLTLAELAAFDFGAHLLLLLLTVGQIARFEHAGAGRYTPSVLDALVAVLSAPVFLFFRPEWTLWLRPYLGDDIWIMGPTGDERAFVGRCRYGVDLVVEAVVGPATLIGNGRGC
jgi:hypothetical protein